MVAADKTRSFIPLSIAVLTVSDTRVAEDDRSGDTLCERSVAAGHSLAGRAIVPDEVAAIWAQVESWTRDPSVDVVITTGGTGFTGRDVTPEAIETFIRETDGRLLGGLPSHLLRQNWDVHSPVAGHGRTRERHLRLRPSGFAGRLPRRLGQHSLGSARLSAPALQLRPRSCHAWTNTFDAALRSRSDHLG